ncbi:MAG: hypothetical protein R3C53_00325 [Pirellulaceae bacterium]
MHYHADACGSSLNYVLKQFSSFNDKPATARCHTPTPAAHR